MADGIDADALEQTRLAELRAYNVLDTPTEIAFDRLTALASKIYAAPIALVSLVDENRQWFKSRCGLDASETPREVSFCAHAIGGTRPFIIRDASADPRFVDNALVTGPPHIRFYAGAPLTTRNGLNLGTLCIIDRVPRPEFAPADADVLVKLAAIAVDELELRAANAEIDRARREADAANMAKADFLANTSHEIRTPLNAIMSLTELALTEPVSDTVHGYLDRIRHVNQLLSRLVQDVLDLSRIEAGRLSLEPQAFDPRELGQAAVSYFESQAAERRLDLRVSIDNRVPDALIGDATRLLQVILNLLGNAMKFTAEGSITLTLTALNVDDDAAELRVAVSDTGRGIPEDELRTIFHRFDQGTSPEQRALGSGLGLAIARGLVALMSGDLEVNSTPGRGSEFSFTAWFPLAADEPDAIAAQNQALQETANLDGLKILLVDDDEISRDAIGTLMRKAGAVVVDLDSSHAALRLVAAQGSDLDVVVTDVEMPGLSGLAATREIRKRFSPGELPVIALTGRAMSEDRDRCLDAGMNAYLTKPVPFADLVATIRHCTYGEAMPATPAPAGMPSTPWRTHEATDAAAQGSSLDLDPELRATMLRRFKDKYSARRHDITSAVQDGALQTAAAEVHALTGAAALLGLQPLARAGRELEVSLRAETHDEIAPCLERFETALHDVLEG